MKIAVGLFNKNNKFNEYFSEILHRTFSNIKLIIVILIITAIFTFVITNFKLSPRMLYFATNFRQAENFEFTLSDILSQNGIYNIANYRFKKEEIIEKAVETTNENQDILEMLDSVAEEKKDTQVLSNIPPSVITAENKTLQRISIGTTKILNYSSKRNIDFNKILAGNVTLTKKSDKILLYSTHTSETYTNSEKYSFPYTGTMRSQDANFNMLTIGKTLNENLRDKGIESIHNTTPHDYGAYTSAYSKSKITVQSALENMGGAGISIDVHRDAVADLTFRPITNIKGVEVAQLMFVMGVGYDSQPNEYWEENLRLALKIQQLADEIYPGLFKNMMIRDSVYNQNLNKYSFLVEVGATGNTIDEAKLSMRCLANLLNIIYKD